MSFEDYKLPPVGHAISGAIGSSISNLFIYPLDLSTTRLQLKEDKQGLLATIKEIYEKEGGLKGLYAGLETDTLASVMSNFLYFYCYTALRNIQEKLNKNMGRSIQLNIAQELFLGAEAALISRFFTTPVTIVTTQLQTGGHKDKTLKQIALEIFREKGITGFWTGYRASMVLVSNPSITYFVFEKVKAFYMRTQKKSSLTSLQVFLFSAFAKTIATLVTYPFIFLRTKMITSGKTNKKQMGLAEAFKQVVRTDGFLGLYKGVQGQVTKGFFNQGIMYMIKDIVATYLAFLFYKSLRGKENRLGH